MGIILGILRKKGGNIEEYIYIVSIYINIC